MNGNFGGGDGTEKNPYLVEDAQDMNAIRNDRFAYYKQTKDIDMSEFWGTFEPICQWGMWSDDEIFHGSYDGNSKKIKNFKPWGDSYSDECVALFGVVVGGTFKNIFFENVYVLAEAYGGALIGVIYDGTRTNPTAQNTVVENCHVLSGEFYAGGMYTAEDAERWSNVTEGDWWGGSQISGLIGAIYADSPDVEVTVNKCSVRDVVIKGGNSIAPITSYLELDGSIVKITNCYAQAEIGQLDDEWYSEMGGLVGDVWWYDGSRLEISHCYSASVMSFYDPRYKATAGALLGHDIEYLQRRVDEPNFTFKSNYFDIEINPQAAEISSLTEVQLKTTTEMKKKETFVGWDFNNIWGIKENETYPFFIYGGPRIQCKSFTLSDF